jgi:hypothetical protein
LAITHHQIDISAYWAFLVSSHFQLVCNQQPKNQQEEAKSKQPHPWAVQKSCHALLHLPGFEFTTNRCYPIRAPLFSPTGFGAESFVNVVATRKSRECAVNSATNYLWFCVSPQDENFQGKPVRPLFSINSLLNILSDY